MLLFQNSNGFTHSTRLWHVREGYSCTTVHELCIDIRLYQCTFMYHCTYCMYQRPGLGVKASLVGQRMLWSVMLSSCSCQCHIVIFTEGSCLVHTKYISCRAIRLFSSVMRILKSFNLLRSHRQSCCLVISFWMVIILSSHHTIQ